MEELFLKGGKLVSQNEWESRIDGLRKETGDSFYSDLEAARKELEGKIVEAVRKRLDTHPGEKVGVFFSGGLDSSHIAAVCKKLRREVVCITAGFQERKSQVPLDVEAAEKVAGHLGLRLVKKIYNYEEAKNIIGRTIALLGKDATPINVAVGAVIVAAAEVAKKEGIHVLFSGLGSEEIYAGYERHAKATDAHEECWQGLKNMYSRDLIRDSMIGEKLGLAVLTPFLDREVIVCSMKFPVSSKLNESGNKIILREIAKQELGEFALRKKKAAQYGSAFQKALEKAAKEKGETIKEYVDSQKVPPSEP